MFRFSLRAFVCLCCVLPTLPVRAQVVYEADGEPTALEEEIRWQLNRARFDRAKENAKRGTSYKDSPARSAPLAPNAALTRAARRHSEDMARRNVFQHETVPGSFYYNASTQKQPWHRMTAEGYVWNLAGENIAAGYTSAISVYVGWWKSGKHRQNMGDADFCEIGNGYYYRAASDYVEYYCMTLGRSGAARFFTGTIFQDANGNGAYTRGEGRAGGRVSLLARGEAPSVCDVSAPAGNFAVPIQTIEAGEVVRVVLENTTAASVTLSLPRDYATLEALTLGPGESRVCGTFVKGGSNVGFRDLVPAADFVSLTPGSRTHDAGGVEGASVEIDSSVAWTAHSAAPWLRVLSGAGEAGGGTLTYAVDPYDFGDARSAVIRVMGEGHVAGSFTVTQQGVPAELQVAPEPGLVPAEGEPGMTLMVTANVTWRASSDADWIVISSGQGVGDGVFSVAVAANPNSVPREAIVAVSGGGLVRELRFFQEAGESPFVAQVVDLRLAEGVVKKVTGLPPGLKWDKVSGSLSGQPTKAGTYRVRVDVQGGDGQVRRQWVTLIVQGLPASAVGTFEARMEPVAGVASGLGGEARFTTLASGAVSGTLRVQGRSHALRGRLLYDPDLAAPMLSLVCPLQDGSSRLVELVLLPDHRCSGTVDEAGLSAPLTGWRRVWKAASPTALAGRFHVLGEVEEAWQGEETVPQGVACLVLRVTSGGRATWSGKLGDGTSVLRSGWLGPEGEAGFWSLLYKSRGAVGGTVALDAGGVVSGDAWWLKAGAPEIRSRVYQRGFGLDHRGAVEVRLAGERWAPPAPGQSLPAAMGLSGAGEEWETEFLHGVMGDTASASPNLALGLSHANHFVLPLPGQSGNEARLTARLSAVSGWISGGFDLLDEDPERPGTLVRRRVAYRALLLPGRRLAAGFFRAPKLADPLASPPVGRADSDVVAGAMLLRSVE